METRSDCPSKRRQHMKGRITSQFTGLQEAVSFESSHASERDPVSAWRQEGLMGFVSHKESLPLFRQAPGCRQGHGGHLPLKPEISSVIRVKE